MYVFEYTVYIINVETIIKLLKLVYKTITSFRNNLCNVYGKVNKDPFIINTLLFNSSMNTYWSADISNIYLLRGGTARFITND